MAGLLRSKWSMVWGRGKNKDTAYMKIFILYSVAHFIYDIRIWRNGRSKCKNSPNCNSKEVILQIIKPGEFPFLLFFNSSVIPWSFRVPPLFSVFLFSSPHILNVSQLWQGLAQVPADCPSIPQDLLPLVTAGHCSAQGFSANARSKILQHFWEISKIIMHLL